MRTELGIHPAASIVIETLPDGPSDRPAEIAACVVRSGKGEMAIEWQDFASRDVFAVLTEALLASATADPAADRRAFGRVPFCALAPTAAE
ncbi:MAG TPA: hypothetical protein VMT66_16540 [Steroidobacteraceae bacterium]|nr:hypothetical protein [Steroidobacteraceae bacterium]